MLGEVGRRPISQLSIGGDGALYAIGAGRVWRSPNLGPSAHTGTWSMHGRYAPRLSWDEAEGISADGPFDRALLTEVERQIGVVLESMLEGQGDEEWITEDAANALIESFEDEPLPALDSPYRVNQVIPQAHGVWLATGSGVWAAAQRSMVTLKRSPRPAIGLAQEGSELWLSTLSTVYRTENYLQDLEYRSEIRWRSYSELKQAKLLRYQGRVYASREDELWLLDWSGSPQQVKTPSGTRMIIAEHGTSDRLWALSARDLWRSVPNQGSQDVSVEWERCTQIDAPLARLRSTSAGLFVVTPRALIQVAPDCENARYYSPPTGESVMMTDMISWDGKLYLATSGGLFSWEGFKSTAHSQVALRYLKRDLALFPALFDIYQAALREQGLEHQSSYGSRPVLSALVPQLRMRYTTRPSREDQLPTFSESNRQLTLLQPRPAFEVFFEWRVSLDFLTTLIDPERASSVAETQSALESISSDDLNLSELESEVGIIEDWSDDTLASQAQRLAMTTLALERRQKHRDRERLRVTITRLHRERIQLTYRRWLSGDSASATEQGLMLLRIQEVDALLDAMTGYTLMIQRAMRSPI